MLYRWDGVFCTLDELTTWFLTQDKAAFNKARDATVLALFLGEEYTQQIHRYLANHLLEYRSEPRFMTIYGTSQSMNSVATIYGATGFWTSETDWLRFTEEILLAADSAER